MIAQLKVGYTGILSNESVRPHSITAGEVVRSDAPELTIGRAMADAPARGHVLVELNLRGDAWFEEREITDVLVFE